jgi:Tol biopolymer transport system component
MRIMHGLMSGRRCNAQISIVIVSSCLILSILGITGCVQKELTVPHEGRFGIYSLTLNTGIVQLLYTTNQTIEGSPSLDPQSQRLVFSQTIDGDSNENFELCSIAIDGGNFTRLSTNNYWDFYPSWAPDGKRLAFLRFNKTLNIYTMDANGSNCSLLYDSGGHDADINWGVSGIVFTRNSCIWMMNDNGTQQKQVTYPPHQGERGEAELPFGDYDPRLSPDGQHIVFTRLIDDQSMHGNYDFYSSNIDGSNETRLTTTGYSQGLSSWSHSGTTLVFIVAAINNAGKYDIYLMDSDGSNQRNITPAYFPNNFLCHSAVFSTDDTMIYFTGEWWE